MMSMVNLRRILIPTLAVAMGATALAACSSSSEPTANKTDAKVVLLQASDVPSGWTKSAAQSQDNSDIKSQAAKFPACAEFLAQMTADKKALKLDSPTWDAPADSSGNSTSISNQVVGYTSVDVAKASYATYSSSNTLTCLKKIFTTLKNQVEAQSGGLTVTLNVGTIDVTKVGDASMAYGVTLEVANMTMAFAIEFVRLGPYVTSYNSTVYPPAPDHFGQKAVKSSTLRLEKATGISGATGA